MKYLLPLFALGAFITLAPVTAEANDYEYSNPYKKKDKDDCDYFCEKETSKDDKYSYDKPKKKSTYNDALHKNRGKKSSISDTVLDGLKTQ